MSSIKLLKQLWGHLDQHRQHQYVILFGLMLIAALVEVVSLGAVLPFLGVLVSPEDIFTYPYMSDVGQVFGIEKPQEMIFPLTLGFGVMAILSGAIRLLLLVVSTRLALATGSDLSVKIYQYTLYQPFSIHASRNSSEVVSGILSKVHFVVYGVLLPALTFVSSMVLLIAILAILILVDPMVAITAIITLGSCYGFVAWVSRHKLEVNGRCVAKEQTKLIRSLQEGLGGIRDVLLNALQPAYCDIYRKADLPLRRSQANITIIGQSPRYIMEAFGLVLISIFAYIMIKSSDGESSSLPVLGVFALGAQRLLPILQQGYAAWASIMGSYASLVDTLVLLNQGVSIAAIKSEVQALKFEKSIEFKDVKFRYSNDEPWVLDGVSFSILKGMRVGFVGSTGSGKSTLLDLFMGLLTPGEGEIRVDGEVVVESRLKAWQKHIAHVPQTIYLVDGTLSENVAFGVSSANVDLKRLHISASQAQLSDFIKNSVDGYETSVGERGGRLSGGQRQRVGIARALYKQADVLVFDEATSALDNLTEQALMEAISNIDKNVTMLFVAHRLSTVKKCDFLIELKHGQVVAQGTYSQLLESSEGFRKMVEINKGE